MCWFGTLKRNAFSQGVDGYLKTHNPPPPPPTACFYIRREVTSAHWK